MNQIFMHSSADTSPTKIYVCMYVCVCASLCMYAYHVLHASNRFYKVLNMQLNEKKIKKINENAKLISKKRYFSLLTYQKVE